MEISHIIKDVVTVGENASFREAISLMVNKKTNTLLVIDKEGILIGEIHISDILDAIVPEYLDGDRIAAHFASDEMFREAVMDAKDLQVSEFMSRETYPVRPTDGLMSVAAVAIANKKAHIPVVDGDNRPVGIISRRGIKHLIADALGIPDSE